MITLRNTPLYTPHRIAQGKRYTLCAMIARAAAVLVVEYVQRMGKSQYCEGSYWAGYRDAFYMVSRMIEGTVDSSSVGPVVNGLEEYNTWLALQDN